MSRLAQRQICPRRLEMVIERIVLAKESFAPQSPEWLVLDNCQRQVGELLSQFKPQPTNQI